MRSISSCLSTELRSSGRGSSLSPEDLEIKEISVYKSAIETDKIKENHNINDRNATVTSLALSRKRNQQLFVSICRFKSEMFSYLSFCAKSEMVVAVPVYSKDGEKIEILLLVELSG